MCSAMAEQKADEQEIGREANFSYPEPEAETGAAASDPPSADLQNISLNSPSSSSTAEFDSLSEASTGPLEEDFDAQRQRVRPRRRDENNNDETVEYYLSEPNTETGEDNLRRLHITRSQDGLPLFTVRAENYNTTARFGPSPHNGHRFLFEHDYHASPPDSDSQDSQERNEYSDYLAAATVFMQEFPNAGGDQQTLIEKQNEFPVDGSGEGGANIPDFNFLGQQNYGSHQPQELFNPMEPSDNAASEFTGSESTVPSSNFNNQYLPFGPNTLPPRGSGLGILGVAPVAFPVLPVGTTFGTVQRNGTTYYSGIPPGPVQYQAQGQFAGMGIPSNVFNQGSTQAPVYYPPPQFQIQQQLIGRPSNLSPFLPNQSRQIGIVPRRGVPQGVMFPPLPILPPRITAGRPYYLRRVPDSNNAQPLYTNQNQGQQPQPQQVSMAVPTYGVGFPQPPPSNGVQFARVNGPMGGVQFVPASNPYQQQQPQSSFAFIPQTTPVQNRFFRQEPALIPTHLPYENINGEGFVEIPAENQGQEPAYVDYYSGQPLMYYPAVEPARPEPTPPVNYTPNVFYYTEEAEGNQGVLANGFQILEEEKTKKKRIGLSELMAKKLMDTTPESTPRTSTAESGDTEVSKLSWSAMMEEEENAYEASASASADSDDNRTGQMEKGSDTSGTLKYSGDTSGCLKGKDAKKMGNSKAGERVREIMSNMVDYGNTFFYKGQEFPYVASVWDDNIMASIRVPRRHFEYYVPPKVRDDDFFGGQQMLWQMKMMEGFCRYDPDVWRMQALPDFQPRGLGWTNFDLTSKLRFCCRSCRRPWTSMRGKILFSMRFDNLAQRGIILMKIFGQVCIQGACNDFDFQSPACYPEEIERVIWKLSEYVGCVFYGIALSQNFYNDPDKAIRTGHPSSAHRKEFCQACQSGFCSKGVE